MPKFKHVQRNPESEESIINSGYKHSSKFLVNIILEKISSFSIKKKLTSIYLQFPNLKYEACGHSIPSECAISSA